MLVPSAQHAVHLVHKDNTRRDLVREREQRPDVLLALPKPLAGQARHRDVDEVGAALRRDGLGEHRLPRARRPEEEDAAGRLCQRAAAEQLGPLQREHHDLLQRGLDRVQGADVLKPDADLSGRDDLRQEPLLELVVRLHILERAVRLGLLRGLRRGRLRERVLEERQAGLDRGGLEGHRLLLPPLLLRGGLRVGRSLGNLLGLQAPAPRPLRRLGGSLAVRRLCPRGLRFRRRRRRLFPGGGCAVGGLRAPRRAAPAPPPMRLAPEWGRHGALQVRAHGPPKHLLRGLGRELLLTAVDLPQLLLRDLELELGRDARQELPVGALPEGRAVPLHRLLPLGGRRLVLRAVEYDLVGQQPLEESGHGALLGAQRPRGAVALGRPQGVEEVHVEERRARGRGAAPEAGKHGAVAAVPRQLARGVDPHQQRVLREAADLALEVQEPLHVAHHRLAEVLQQDHERALCGDLRRHIEECVHAGGLRLLGLAAALPPELPGAAPVAVAVLAEAAEVRPAGDRVVEPDPDLSRLGVEREHDPSRAIGEWPGRRGPRAPDLSWRGHAVLRAAPKHERGHGPEAPPAPRGGAPVPDKAHPVALPQRRLLAVRAAARLGLAGGRRLPARLQPGQAAGARGGAVQGLGRLPGLDHVQVAPRQPLGPGVPLVAVGAVVQRVVLLPVEEDVVVARVVLPGGARGPGACRAAPPRGAGGGVVLLLQLELRPVEHQERRLVLRGQGRGHGLEVERRALGPHEEDAAAQAREVHRALQVRSLGLGRREVQQAREHQLPPPAVGEVVRELVKPPSQGVRPGRHLAELLPELHPLRAVLQGLRRGLRLVLVL
mmetsp:Transcript_19650/g.46900  ORF Transcript_19650/g.46900 Transcript_19650/m.46900 type:complete len:833 (-) Transcript_19650:1531-4029(-)